MSDVAIFGAGGLGRMVRDIVLQAGRERPVAFLDSDAARHGRTVDGLRIYGGLERLDELLRRGVRGVVVAIGNNRARTEIAQHIQRRGIRLISAVHPLASVAHSARLGPHLIIGARSIICVDARVAAHSVLCTGTIVEHDNAVGEGVFLHPAVRLAGGVVVEDYATLAIGACVIPYRRIGRGAYVEPGAVVIRDVPAGTVVGGVPARTRAGGDALIASA